MLGGGAFGNRASWISDAILRSLMLAKSFPLRVRLVSFGNRSDIAANVISRWLQFQRWLAFSLSVSELGSQQTSGIFNQALRYRPIEITAFRFSRSVSACHAVVARVAMCASILEF